MKICFKRRLFKAKGNAVDLALTVKEGDKLWIYWGIVMKSFYWNNLDKTYLSIVQKILIWGL